MSIKNTDDMAIMRMEKYYMKTRGLRITEVEADLMGIKRIYNYTSDIDFMDSEHMEEWSNGLYNAKKGEAIIIESAFREVNGVQLYVMSCIVFHTIEQSNLYYIRSQKSFGRVDGFLHLYN